MADTGFNGVWGAKKKLCSMRLFYDTMSFQDNDALGKDGKKCHEI